MRSKALFKDALIGATPRSNLIAETVYFHHKMTMVSTEQKISARKIFLEHKLSTKLYNYLIMQIATVKLFVLHMKVH